MTGRKKQDSQNGKDADFDCMPMNMDVLDSAGASTELQGGVSSSALAASFHARRTADCKMWNPDMPEVLGLYHAYVRGYNKDTRWCSFFSHAHACVCVWEGVVRLCDFLFLFFFLRTHKLFIITSGGCSNLSDKFYNLSVDIRGSDMTVEDVLESEEAYYLRRINGR